MKRVMLILATSEENAEIIHQATPYAHIPMVSLEERMLEAEAPRGQPDELEAALKRTRVSRELLSVGGGPKVFYLLHPSFGDLAGRRLRELTDSVLTMGSLNYPSAAFWLPHQLWVMDEQGQPVMLER
jgi:hypothetical protein